MKITLLSTTVLHFSAVSRASAANDVSRLTVDTKSSREADYPILADDVDEDLSEMSNELPDYCHKDVDHGCYKKGVPKCCVKTNRTCPSDKRPHCDIRISTRIQPGYACQVDYDRCKRGYDCISGICATAGIAPGEDCMLAGTPCAGNYSCRDINGIYRCVSRDRAGCRSGSDCAGVQTCVNGECRAGGEQWYTSNWSDCVMDCPTDDGPCCGGSAETWEQTYSSLDACCGQSALRWNKDACMNASLQCSLEDHGAKLELKRFKRKNGHSSPRMRGIQ